MENEEADIVPKTSVEAPQSLPTIVNWWRNYRKDTIRKVERDEEGMYQCIKQRHSPPPSEEVEMSITNEQVKPTHRVKFSGSNIKQEVSDAMKSISCAGIMYLKNMNEEAKEQLFRKSTIVERNISVLWASLNNRSDILESLIKLGIDVNYREAKEGLTALHLAAFSDSVDCAKILISYGVDVNITSNKFTPLETACFHNSLNVAKLLLDNGAKIKVNKSQPNKETTAFQSAVIANAVQCVQLLLQECQDEYSTTIGGISLHLAAEMGHLQCIKIFLDRGIDPDFMIPNSKTTALHHAAEGGFTDCVSLLLSRGANVDARNDKGQSALHFAARAQSVECVEVLLKKGGCDPNSEDCEKRTPLHSAAARTLHPCEITEMLIKWGAHVNSVDMFGYTPLHLAALNGNTQCVELLIRHGADVTARTKGGNTALSIITRKTPVAIKTVYKKFDSAITVQDPEVTSIKEVIMKLDFRIFFQGKQKGEMKFLTTFLQDGHKDILEHPLCQAFLYVKWEKIRKYYIARVLLYLALVLSLTGYVLTAIGQECNKEPKEGMTESKIACNKTSTFYYLKHSEISVSVMWYCLIFFTICETIRKVYTFTGFATTKQYLRRIENVIEWFVLIGCAAVEYIFRQRIGFWQKNVSAFVVLFAWINLMLVMGQLPVLGSYVAMYMKIQKEFAKLFVAYACLIIGFTFSFCIIFSGRLNFENPAYGFIQAVAIMIGNVDVPGVLLTYESIGVSACLSFLMFMLFVTIILMNLLVGIAVRDIQGLEKTAGLSKLVHQTKFMSSIETSLLNKWLPKYILTLLYHAALISPSGYRVVLTVKPLNKNENRLPKDILMEAYDLAKSKNNTFGSFRRNSIIKFNSPEAPKIENLQNDIERLREEIQELKEIIKSMK